MNGLIIEFRVVIFVVNRIMDWFFDFNKLMIMKGFVKYKRVMMINFIVFIVWDIFWSVFWEWGCCGGDIVLFRCFEIVLVLLGLLCIIVCNWLFLFGLILWMFLFLDGNVMVEVIVICCVCVCLFDFCSVKSVIR